MNRIALCVCTSDAIKAQTVIDLINITTSGLIQTFTCTMGTLLPHARNDAVRLTYELNPDFTHLIFIDDDTEGVSVELIEHLLAQDKDIIAPLIPYRRPPFAPAVKMDLDILKAELEKKPADRTCLRVDGVGMACTLIKREVFDNTCEGKWFFTDRGPRPGFVNEVQQAAQALTNREWETDDPLQEAFLLGARMGQQAHVGAPEMGEDLYFCNIANQFGYSTWLDPRVAIRHTGDYHYSLFDWHALVKGTAFWKRNLRAHKSTIIKP